jgi:hypothetical protein
VNRPWPWRCWRSGCSREPHHSNVSLLEQAAAHLGDALLELLVFVGGAVAGLLITDPAMPDIRPTQDVDVWLPSGCAIRIVTAPVFLTTRLEAFRGRGLGNFLFSHDLEDLMAAVDGRASLLEECRLSPPELRNELAAQFLELLNISAFLEALPAFLAADQISQQRLPDLRQMLAGIAALAEP